MLIAGFNKQKINPNKTTEEKMFALNQQSEESLAKSLSGALIVLSKKDRKKFLLISLFQVFFGILDLMGVLLIGFLGSLIITGITYNQP